MKDIHIEHWIKRLKEGDPSAFQVIYEWSFPEIYRSVVFLMTDKHEIEDVMNEIYFQLWRSIDNYDANRPFRLWLYGIAMKQIQKWRTKSWRRFRIFKKKITLVYLTPTMVFVVLMSVMNTFKIFRETYLIAGDYPHDSIYTLQHYMNNMFLAMDVQKLSAAATLMVIVSSSL